MRNAKIIICILLACLAGGQAFASRSERKAAVIAESETPRTLRGAEKFDVAMPYDATFEAVVKYLKTQDYEVSVADRDAGLVATAIEVTGGYRQTGTRVVVSLIKDTAATTVRVCATGQKRYKALQTEPWSEPKIDTKKTAEVANKLKTSITPNES